VSQTLLSPQMEDYARARAAFLHVEPTATATMPMTDLADCGGSDKADTANLLGFVEPAPTPWLGFRASYVQLVGAFILAPVGTGLIWLAWSSNPGHPNRGAMSTTGATIIIAALVLIVGSWRDVRAKDASRRIEVRLERLIELAMTQSQASDVGDDEVHQRRAGRPMSKRECG
jgi:hypothetical protein